MTHYLYVIDSNKENRLTKVIVYHANNPTFGLGAPRGGFTRVAEVEVSDATPHLEGLDLAYAHTQNIGGSWSRGPTLDGERNPDYNAGVAVLAPLPTHDGRTYGIRSTSVGDILEVNALFFQVASIGFEPAAPPEVTP